MTVERHDRRSLLRVGAGVLSAAVAGCLGGATQTNSVAMVEGLAYDPATVTVVTGTTITWTNDSGVGHTVTAYGDRLPEGAEYFATGGFETEADARQFEYEGVIGPGQTYEHTFETAGTYPYFCVPHEASMVGTVEVR